MIKLQLLKALSGLDYNLLTKFDFGMTPTGDSVNREMSSKFMASILLADSSNYFVVSLLASNRSASV